MPLILVVVVNRQATNAADCHKMMASEDNQAGGPETDGGGMT